MPKSLHTASAARLDLLKLHEAPSLELGFSHSNHFPDARRLSPTCKVLGVPRSYPQGRPHGTCCEFLKEVACCDLVSTWPKPYGVEAHGRLSRSSEICSCSKDWKFASRATMHLSQSRVQMSVSMVNSLGINLPVDDLKEFRCFDMSICKRTTDVSSSALKWLWPRWGQLREQDSSTPTGSSSMKVWRYWKFAMPKCASGMAAPGKNGASGTKMNAHPVKWLYRLDTETAMHMFLGIVSMPNTVMCLSPAQRLPEEYMRAAPELFPIRHAISKMSPESLPLK